MDDFLALYRRTHGEPKWLVYHAIYAAKDSPDVIYGQRSWPLPEAQPGFDAHANGDRIVRRLTSLFEES